VKALAESTVLLLLTVFTTVNISLVVLKRRPGEPRGGFEPPIIVPMLGALVCASLIVVRLQLAFDSSKSVLSLIYNGEFNFRAAFTTNVYDKLFEPLTAPLIAGAIVLISMALYKALKPKNVVAKIED
jgi:amino acid transporter